MPAAAAVDWVEVRGLLDANFTPQPTPTPGLTLPSGACAANTADAFKAVAEKLFTPLVFNALEKGAADPRVRGIRAGQPWLAFALDNVSGTSELLRAAGFTLQTDADGAEPRYVLSGAANANDLPQAAREVERAALEKARDVVRGARDDLELHMAELAARRPATRTVAAPEVKSRIDRVAQEEEMALLKAKIARDQAERVAAQRADAESAAAAMEGEVADYQAAEHLHETVKRTLHFTGRLRNASFGGKMWHVRTMRHGRRYACGDAECLASPDNLEVHWHLETGKLLYGYVAHMSSDGSKVLHVGPELGYQYNSMPHTEHFGKTLLTSRNVSTVEGKPISHENLNEVVSSCKYCGVSFEKLWS